MKGNLRFMWQDLKRAVSLKGFWISIMLLLALFFHAINLYVSLDREISTYEIIVDAMALSGFGPFAAVFPSIGYSVRVCEEYNSGYMKMITSRMNPKCYGIVRTISVGLSGGIMVGFPFLVVCLFAFLFGEHGIPQDGFMEESQLVYYIAQYGDWFVLFFKVFLGFLFGVLFSLVSLAFAIWTCNRYVTIIAPFVLYEVMWVVLYNVQILNPIYLVRGDDLNSYPLSCFMEIIYIAVTLIVIWIGWKKKVWYE